MSQMNFSLSARRAVAPPRAVAPDPRAMLASRASRHPVSGWGMISAAIAVASAVFLIVWLL